MARSTIPIERADYFEHDQDISGDPMYYGFMKSNGHWFIMKSNTAAGTFRYVAGITAYSDFWGNRASLSYSTIDEVF